MSMPTVEELIEGAKVLITWGGYMMLYGLITVIIGIIILVVLNLYVEAKQPVKRFK